MPLSDTELTELVSAGYRGNLSWKRQVAARALLSSLFTTGPQSLTALINSLPSSTASTLEDIDVPAFLIQIGAVETTADPVCWELTIDTRLTLEAAERRISELAATAAEEFSSLLAKSTDNYQGLTWEIFREEYLRPVITEYGARTLDLATGTRHSDAEERLTKEFLSRFPAPDRLLVRHICSQFLSSGRPRVRDYLLQLWSEQLYRSSFELSPRSIDSVSRALGEKPKYRFLCDTNFLFSVLGLHANPANHSSVALLRLAARGPQVPFESNFAFLNRTVREAQAALRDAGNRWNFLVSPTYAQEALKLEDQYGLDKCFMEFTAASDVEVHGRDHFREISGALTELIDHAGIKAASINEEEIQRSAEYERRLNRNRFENRRRQNPKPDRLLIHDTLLQSAVAFVRPVSSTNALRAGWWVVTEDRYLVADDLRRAEDDEILPTCLSPATALSLLQFWTGSETVAEPLMKSLAEPLLFIEFDPEAERATRRILRQVRAIKSIDQSDAELARRILANRAMRKLVSAQDEVEDDESILEEISLAVADQAREYASRVQKLEHELSELNTSLSAGSERTERLEKELSLLKRKYESSKERHRRAEKDLEAARARKPNRKKNESRGRHDDAALVEATTELAEMKAWETFRRRAFWPGVNLTALLLLLILGICRVTDLNTRWAITLVVSLTLAVVGTWWSEVVPDIQRTRNRWPWKFLLIYKDSARWLLGAQLLLVIITLALDRLL